MPGGAHENMRGWTPEEDELLLSLIQVHRVAKALLASCPPLSEPQLAVIAFFKPSNIL